MRTRTLEPRPYEKNRTGIFFFVFDFGFADGRDFSSAAKIFAGGRDFRRRPRFLPTAKIFAGVRDFRLRRRFSPAAEIFADR